MKRFIFAALVFSLALQLSSCGQNSAPVSGGADISRTEQHGEQSVTSGFEASESFSETETGESDETTEPVPMEKADVLKIYNDAMAKVKVKKTAFEKIRETGNESYTSDLALKAFKDTVFKFIGIGGENIYSKSVERNDARHTRHFNESTLTEDDIDDAVCETNGEGVSTITIKVKDGSSSITNGADLKINAPIDKCGISAGEDDKEFYDHKSAQNIFDAIDKIAAKATVNESYQNAVVKAETDKKGRLISLEVAFDIDVEILGVYDSGCRVTAATVVRFSDFAW